MGAPTDRTLHQKLEETNQELESFSYSISHDLRAPLRHISGFAALLQEHLSAKNDREGRDMVVRILNAAQRMEGLIQDLLEFSQASRKPLLHLPINTMAMIQDILNDGRDELKSRLVEWIIEPLPSIEGDPHLLRQAFAHLIGNAIKFTSRREHAIIQIGLQKTSASEWIFFVRDNGVGFKMEQAKKLFGLFQRLHTPQPFEGTGVGLAHVRRIIHRHGGRTWAEGRPDEGAIFYFSLPIPTKKL